MEIKKIGIEEIIPNPKNPRDMSLQTEKEALGALKRSMSKVGFMGEPVSVVEITDPTATLLGINKASLNPNQRYVVVSGHRRLEAMRGLWEECIETGKLGKDGAQRYETIPALVRTDVEGAKLILTITTTNANRQSQDVVSKAKNARLIREAIYNDRLAAIMSKKGIKEEKREEEIKVLKEKLATEKVVSDADIGAIMGTSSGTQARYRVLLTLPETFWPLFASGILKEANISEIAARIKEKVSPDLIMANIVKDKDKTYESLRDAINVLSPDPKVSGKIKKIEEKAEAEPDAEKEAGCKLTLQILDLEEGVKVAGSKDSGLTFRGDATDALISMLLGKLHPSVRARMEPVIMVLTGANVTITRDGMRTMLNLCNANSETGTVDSIEEEGENDGDAIDAK